MTLTAADVLAMGYQKLENMDDQPTSWIARR